MVEKIKTPAFGKGQNAKERNDLEDTGADGRVIYIRADLKNRMEGRGLHYSGSG
jgi:hypothetical protein